MSKRRIPTDKEWFDYKNNKYASWLYCFMSSSASFHDKLYYKKQHFYADLGIIKKCLGIQDKRTINKYIDILLKNGYLSQDEENFYFPFVMNNGTYILIDKDLLYNISMTKSHISAQTFIYLSNRMKMKREQYNETTYNFTLKELRIAFGYSETSQNSRIESAIRECLQTLKAEKYIDYENVYVDLLVRGVPEKVPNYKLTYITEKLPKELERIKEEEKKIVEEQEKKTVEDFKNEWFAKTSL